MGKISQKLLIQSRKWTIVLPILGVLVLLGGCKQSNPFTGKKPAAFGKPNHVDVVMDKTLAESPVWDSLDYYFASSYPVLPAPEPFFDLRLLTPEDLEYDPYKKELKTLMIVADLDDTASVATRMVKNDLGEEKWKRALSDPGFTMTIARDKWASGQMLVYLFAKGREALASKMRGNFAFIAARVNLHDAPALEASVYGIKGNNAQISDLVFNKYGLQMTLPHSFVVAMEEDNFLWLRADDKISVQNLIIRKFPYTNEDQFSVKNLIEIRDDYGKKYIQTSHPGAYMRTNPKDLPVYEYKLNLGTIYGKEYRGIWETVNDFMGGPFISYLMLNQAKNEIIFIDAFVFAPGEDKRDMMQKLDHVVKRSRF